MTKSVSILCALVFVVVLGKCQNSLGLKEGDILFQKLPCGTLCDAIIETTPCKKDRLFNHCGIIHIQNDSTFVIEAHTPKVEATPLESFLKRDKSDSIYVGRLIEQQLVDKSVITTISKKGIPYDGVYLPNDSAIYCSELVWKSYSDNAGKPLFPPTPMTFKSPKTGKTYDGWISYYQSIHEKIPEGELGTNPCAIANSNKIQFFVLKKPI